MNASLQALSGHGDQTQALQVTHRGDLSVEAAGATTLVVTVRMDAAQAQHHPAACPWRSQT